MTTKFTPGPWKVVADEISYGDVPCEQIESERWIVALALADANDLSKQVTANANLIAAAPDLFEALDELQRASSDIPAVRNNPKFGDLRMAALRALSKARGEPS